jgi:hypothetical protein
MEKKDSGLDSGNEGPIETNVEFNVESDKREVSEL